MGRRGCFVESMLTSSMVTSGEEKTLGEASHTAESSICLKLKYKRVDIFDIIAIQDTLMVLVIA